VTISARATRVLTLTATGVLVVIGVAEFIALWGYIDSQNAIGADFSFFRSIGERWLDTGQFYLPSQLTGPYVVQTQVHVLYPPMALLLFVPFVWLPAVLWWVIPIGTFLVAIHGLRPARWAWPFMAAGIAYPPTVSQLIYGNTNMWVAAAIAAGVRWGWPSVLVLIKPALAPFALVGARSRRWWAALIALGLASVPFGRMWIDYATAMRNSSLSWMYGLPTLPLMFVPVVAWLARRIDVATLPTARGSTGPGGRRGRSLGPIDLGAAQGPDGLVDD